MTSGPMVLDGRRIVVTGATSGLGEAMARALLGAGAAVGVAARPGARLEDAVRRLEHDGLRGTGGPGGGRSRVLALPVDVRDPESVTTASGRAIDVFGGVDMVVNNAGIGMRTVNPRFFEHAQPFYDVEPSAFNDVVATNLAGYFLVARAFARHFLARGGGRFVNVSINRETMVRAGFVPYGPSRAASEALSMVMTEDLRPHGVAVNVLLPGGATDTGMIPETLPLASRASLLDPSIMGPPAVFLASDEADGLTGARIVASEFDQWVEQYRAAGRSGTGRAAGQQ